MLNDFQNISAASDLRDLITVQSDEMESEREILRAFDVDTQAGIDHSFLQ